MLKERIIEQLDWKEKGKAVGGYLLGIQRVKMKDGSVALQYMVRRIDESRVFFLGATKINLALSPSDVGKFVQIEYLGEDETKEVRSDRNRPKLFKVSVDDERTMYPSGSNEPGDPGITDEDIPF